MANPLAQRWAALKKPQQAAVLGGAFALVAVLLYLWLHSLLGQLGPDREAQWLPNALIREGTAESVWNQIAATEDQIRQAEATIAKHPGIIKRLEELQGQIQVAQGLLPKEKEREQIREMLERYMREVSPQYGAVSWVGGTINDRTAKTNDPRGKAANREDSFNALAFDIECTVANMEGLVAYIDKIETSTERFMVVERFSVTPGAVSLDKDTREIVMEPHKVRLTAVTYTFQEAGR